MVLNGHCCACFPTIPADYVGQVCLSVKIWKILSRVRGELEEDKVNWYVLASDELSTPDPGYHQQQLITRGAATHKG